MGKYKRPLKRSFLIGTLAFILLLCIVLSTAQFFRYRTMFYSRYENYIENILHYVAGGIDVDDLAECMRTGVTSEKFDALQQRLDAFLDYTDIHFIYIIEPLNTNERDNIRNIMAGASKDQYENDDGLVYLDMPTGDSYSPATAKKYLDAYNSGELSFFEENSEWGDDYTGLLPLFDSSGNRVAALCVDVAIEEIHKGLYNNTVNMIAMILLLSLVFAGVFYIWTTRNVTQPIEQLERSVAQFANDCKDQRNPDALQILVPAIHTDNEVASLALAVTKLSEAMQSYVKNIVLTESELSRMAVLANKDALTSVRNKNAYNAYAIELQSRMRSEKLRFAMLMVDLNGLKGINDHYGHEKGDLFIQGCCKIICEIFTHSPVFRVGGDEFVVVLMGQDYESRAALIKKAHATFELCRRDVAAFPWMRYSAAIGAADYNPGVDKSIEQILSRADKQMYENKEKLKKPEAHT